MSHVAIFTVLPNGVVATNGTTSTVRFSVLVSPRLDDASTTILGTPFEDWPSIAKKLTAPAGTAASSFTLWINSPERQYVAKLDADTRFATGRFDSDLWRTIFASAAVAPFTKNPYATSAISSYDTKQVSATLKDAYKNAAVYTDPTTGAAKRPTLQYLPPGTSGDVLSNHVHGVARSVPSASTLVSTLRQSPVVDSTGVPQPNLSLKAVKTVNTSSYNEFTRAAVHHNHKQVRTDSGYIPPAGAPKQPPPLAQPSADFHRIVGQLADHPALLRRLGLILDFTVDIDATLAGSQAFAILPGTWDSTTWVVLLKSPDPTKPWTLDARHPWSQGILSPTDFRAFSQTADGTFPGRPKLLSKDGQLLVDSTTGSYHVEDLDLDHAAVHFTTFSEDAVEKLEKQLAAGAPTTMEAALPALKSTGLALHQVARESDVATKFTNSYSYNRATDQAQGRDSVITFYAEDMLRGYRVDVAVMPAGQNGAWTGLPWKSLCSRTVTFGFDAVPGVTLPKVPDISDEGHVRAGAMATSDVNASVPIYSVNESLFNWSGWSLVAQRPGMSIAATADGARLTEHVVTPDNHGAAVLNVPMRTTIKAQHGLPRLRFGNSYKFRVRAVDLAGNDMRHLAPGAAPNATVSASDVTTDAITFRRYEPVAPPALVLRRAVTEGESAEVLVIRSDPYGPNKWNATQWAANNPKAGMNDYHETCERHVAPPKTSQQMAEYHGAFDALMAVPQNAWRVAVKEEGTFFDDMIVDSAVSHLPNVPQPGRAIVTPKASCNDDGSPPLYQGNAKIPRGEPLAQGQYITFDTNEVRIPYLPDVLATGITLQGVQSTPVTRTFAPRVAGGSWPELGVFRLVLAEPVDGIAAVNGVDSSAQKPGPTDALNVLLPAGTMVDAVYSSTLSSPAVMAFNPGDRDATAKAGLLNVLTPSRKLKLVHAVQRPAPSHFAAGNIVPAARKPGDTSVTFPNVTLPVDGNTASHVDLNVTWKEYVDDGKDGVDPSVSPVIHNGTLASYTVAYGAQNIHAAQQVVQLFGDTKRRDVTYSTKATTRYREYFPASITSSSDNITTKSDDVALTIPSTARPPAPRILYVVPSFKWVPSTDGKTRTRSGSLRVYVDRPWYCTGQDERLAVVLRDTTLPGASQGNISHLVSTWGQDPVWSPGTGLGTLNVDHFGILPTEKNDRVKTVTLAEPGGGAVTIVTFKPSFNMERKLWYFDIHLGTDKAYFPFIRLALARYQPASLAGLELSTVVRTEFAQIAADRTASVAPAGGTNYQVTVSGTFGSNANATNPTLQQAASGHYVTAEFQEARTDGKDALDWVSITSAAPLPAQMTGGQVSFSGILALRNAAPGKLHRVLVKEYEIFQTDDQSGVVQKHEPLIPGGAPVAVTYRLVYADGIPV